MAEAFELGDALFQILKHVTRILEHNFFIGFDVLVLPLRYVLVLKEHHLNVLHVSSKNPVFIVKFEILDFLR